MTRERRLPWASAACLVGTLGLSSAALSAPPPGHTLGFVLTWFGWWTYKGDDDCPNGLSSRPSTDGPTNLARLPPEVRAKYKNFADVDVLDDLGRARGPGGENVCEHPDASSPDSDGFKVTRLVQGKHAYGLNLDDNDGTGAAPANTCRHENFIGPDGTPGVDNQQYRIQGCVPIFRTEGPGGMVSEHHQYAYSTGEATFLVEVTHVDDTVNDPDVEVAIYNGAEAMVKGADGKTILTHATFTPVRDPLYHTKVHGKIVNGVLTTDTMPDLYLKGIVTEVPPQYHFRHARLRVDLRPDGTMGGVLGAYHAWEPLARLATRAGEGYATASCDGTFMAMKKLADGDRDPETGACTTISLAYKIEGIPAFIVHPAQETAGK